MKRGSGNTIVIAHSNGLNTRYYHLSRFARGLHAGQQVKQKDVIGFVGTTGLSTGPHLHFSVTKNGAFVDPSQAGRQPRPARPRPRAFMDAIRPRIAALKAMQPGAVARTEDPSTLTLSPHCRFAGRGDLTPLRRGARGSERALEPLAGRSATDREGPSVDRLDRRVVRGSCRSS